MVFFRKYDDALEYHRQSLVLCPQNPATLSAIGYVYLLTGRSAEAVDYFHKALGLRRDDTFSTTMLGNAIEQLMSEMSPCDGKYRENLRRNYLLLVCKSKREVKLTPLQASSN